MSRSVRLCFVCILSMLFVGASGMAWARSITSISVDTATSTVTISCEAGEVGDGHVVYANLGVLDLADRFQVILVCADGGKTSWCFDSPFKTYFNTGCGRIL